MKKILFIAIMIFMTATVAQAHERWAGSYAGLSLGGMLGTTTANDGAFLWSGGDQSLTDAAYSVGILGGHNWLFGPQGFVGLEVDLNWTNFHPERRWAGGSFINEAEWNWFSTVRARGGIAHDKTLLFVTAGLALVDVEYSFGDVTDSDYWANSSKTSLGYTAGAGVEYAYNDQMSLRGEYLYIGLPSEEFTPFCEYSSCDNGDFVSSANIFRVAAIFDF